MKTFHKAVRASAFFCLLSFGTLTEGTAQARYMAEDFSPCTQSLEEVKSLLDLTDRDQYITYHLYFIGLFDLRDKVLRRRASEAGLAEGNIFERSKLEAGLKQISKIRKIVPTTLDDVRVTLDVAKKNINVGICINQKAKS